MRWLALLLLVPLQALADPDAGPRFEPRSLPVPHIYEGGWEHFVGGGVAVLDCNGDGYQDLFMAGGEAPARLFVNAVSAPGEPLTFAQGDLPDLKGVTGAYPLDIDSDGWLDLVVLRVGQNLVLKGQGGCLFEDVTALWGLGGGDQWSTAFSATWEAGRDWPTLAFGNYVDRSDPDGPFEACDSNTLYRYDNAGYSGKSLDPGYCPLSILFSDWNRDGTQDLRMSNDRHYYVRAGSEQMWAMPELRLMDGAGWEPISIWGMGIASQDLTGDGRPEVVLTSMGDQLMQIAGEEGYRAAPYSIGSYAQRPYLGDDGRPSTGWHAEFGDVDNDGRADLFIAKGNVDQMPGLAMEDPNNLLMQAPDGTFAEHGGHAGIANFRRSRGAALEDLNNDGLLDLVVVNRRAEAELYQNVSEPQGGWLAVSLSQPGANINGVGAWVEVMAEGRAQVQEVVVGGGHAGGSAGPLHFGLGPARSAKLRVLWPDGVMGAWREVGVDQRIMLTRSD